MWHLDNIPSFCINNMTLLMFSLNLKNIYWLIWSLSPQKFILNSKWALNQCTNVCMHRLESIAWKLIIFSKCKNLKNILQNAWLPPCCQTLSMSVGLMHTHHLSTFQQIWQENLLLDKQNRPWVQIHKSSHGARWPLWLYPNHNKHFHTYTNASSCQTEASGIFVVQNQQGTYQIYSH